LYNLRRGDLIHAGTGEGNFDGDTKRKQGQANVVRGEAGEHTGNNKRAVTRKHRRTEMGKKMIRIDHFYKKESRRGSGGA